MTRIAINGFGRIGRQCLRIAMGRPGLEVAAVNNLRGDPQVLAHLLRHDSVHGAYRGTVETSDSELIVDGHPIRVLGEPDPVCLPWDPLGVDVVIEATGAFRRRETAATHLRSGAGKVLITAPSGDADATFVVGVNDDTYDPDAHHVVSGASCTTQCLAVVAKVLHERFGISGALATTVHAFTRDQELLDGLHEDPRRGRAAPFVVAPTKTGAARAVATVLPELEGRISGIAVRVPVSDVSLVDLSVTLEAETSVDEINSAFRGAADGSLGSVLGVSDEPLVSVDFVGDSRSAVVDTEWTRTAPGNQFKVLAWYDNEWGYSERMIDLAALIGRTASERAPVGAAASMDSSSDGRNA